MFEGFRREAPDVVWCGRDAGGDQTFRTSLFTVVGRDTVGGEKYICLVLSIQLGWVPGYHATDCNMLWYQY